MITSSPFKPSSANTPRAKNAADDTPYPTLAQAAAATLAAVGAILIGLGVVVLLAWTYGLEGHFEGLWQVTQAYYLLLLVGSSFVLSALPVVGPSLIRPLINAAD